MQHSAKNISNNLLSKGGFIKPKKPSLPVFVMDDKSSRGILHIKYSADVAEASYAVKLRSLLKRRGENIADIQIYAFPVRDNNGNDQLADLTCLAAFPDNIKKLGSLADLKSLSISGMQSYVLMRGAPNPQQLEAQALAKAMTVIISPYGVRTLSQMQAHAAPQTQAGCRL